MINPVAGADTLTSRERECLALAALPLNSKEIGKRLGLSSHTVNNHIVKALHKLGVPTRQAAIRLLREQGGLLMSDSLGEARVISEPMDEPSSSARDREYVDEKAEADVFGSTLQPGSETALIPKEADVFGSNGATTRRNDHGPGADEISLLDRTDRLANSVGLPASLRRFAWVLLIAAFLVSFAVVALGAYDMMIGLHRIRSHASLLDDNSRVSWRARSGKWTGTKSQNAWRRCF